MEYLPKTKQQKEGENKMQVVIINRELNRDKKYQIMYQTGSGFDHVYAGNLFTLEEAIAICNENNLEVKTIGNIWECIK